MTMGIKSLIPLAVIALLLSPAPASAQEEVVYYHTDAIGSVRAITDATGAVLGRYDYLPFGELWPSVPPAPAEVRQFGGKERDDETGFDYFGARYHRAQSGRFTSVDPVLNIETAMTDPQRWNRYAYALNNPLKFIDPDGRDPRVVGGLIGALTYTAWNAYVNTQQGRPWYENVGVEAGKGFLVGVTLGLAAPAMPLTDLGAGMVTASAAGVAKSSGDLGKIIGWGTNQSPADVAQTIRVTRELTQSRVAELVRQGVTREWVQKQLTAYQQALEAGGKKLDNTQLLPRIELMKKLLEYLPKDERF
jgi:RHS repeat-associated protein